MLKGTLIIKDEELGNIEYELSIRDTFNDTKMYLEPVGNYEEYYTGVNYFDLDVDADGNRKNMFDEKCLYEKAYVMEKRRLDVKRGNKYKSNILNKDMCLKVSSLLRYVQSYKTDSEVIQGTTIRRSNIEGVGFVENNLGLMHKINISNKYCSIVAETVSDAQITAENMFSELKAKDKYGNYLSSTPVVNVAFMLCEEYLGFEYVPVAKKEIVNLMGVYETIEEVIENNPDKNTEWILDRKYEIVTDDNLEAIIKEFEEWDGYIAFDTETTGLSITFKSRTNEDCQLVGVVFSKEKGTGYYFPLQHKLFKNLCNGDHHYFMEKYMRNILETKKIICHNTQYDWKVAHIYDINTNVVYDTMIAFQVTKRYEEPTFEYGLKSLAKNILGLDMFDLGDFVISGSFKDSNIGFWDLPFELVRRYAPADADMTLSLFEFIETEKMLAKYDAKRVFEMEITFAKAASYSEFYGYHADMERIPQLQEDILGAMDKYTKEMFKLAGREFNPNSPAQLVPIMYDDLGIEEVEGGRSTSKDKLKILAKMEDLDGNPKYPFVVALRNYRTNEGIYKNFLKRLPEFSTTDGFIFPGVQSLGTTTGRCAVKNPNYQSYNDAVKKYITPRDGFMMFDSDFSQIEYRVLSSMAGQDNLMKEFNDPDLDYHQYQASRMFNVPYALVSGALRQQSKGVNFGLPYGMGDGSLGKAIFGEQTKENTVKAGQLRRKFFQGQEKIENFFEVVRSGGVRDGHTSTLFGRRRYYQRGIFSVSAIRRQAGNHVIQGSSADIYKMAVNQMFNRVVKEGWLGKVLFNGFIHDELLMEVHQSINMYEFLTMWREEFEVKIENFCRLYSGIGCGFCWYDAKKEDFPPQYLDVVVAKYKSNPDMEWDGNLAKFRKELYEEFEAHKHVRIKDYILAPEHQDDVIKPAINKLLEEVSGKIRKEWDSNGLMASKLLEVPEASSKGLVANLKVFCNYWGIAFDSINILETKEIAPKGTEANSSSALKEDDSLYASEISPLDMVSITGTYLDVVNKKLYIVNKPLMTDGIKTDTLNYLMSKGVFEVQGNYRVVLVNLEDSSGIEYDCFVSDCNYRNIVSPLYSKLNNANSFGVRQL